MRFFRLLPFFIFLKKKYSKKHCLFIKVLVWLWKRSIIAYFFLILSYWCLLCFSCRRLWRLSGDPNAVAEPCNGSPRQLLSMVSHSLLFPLTRFLFRVPSNRFSSAFDNRKWVDNISGRTIIVIVAIEKLRITTQFTLSIPGPQFSPSYLVIKF